MFFPNFLLGIRIPDHDFIRALCRNCRGPIALTSANPSSAASTLSIDEFKRLFPALHTVYDGGVLGDTPEARAGSTVVDLSQEGVYRVVRDGSAISRTRSILEGHGLREA